MTMVDLMFGFHLGSGGGNQNGIGEYMQQLNAAGKAFCIMSADAFPLEAQQIMLDNPDVPHTVVFRRSVGHEGTVPPSGNPDVPEYTLPPVEAAARHFGWHLAHRPAEMHPDVWLMGENEIASRFEFDNEAAQIAVPLFDGLRQRYTRTDPVNGAIVYGVTNGGWMAAYSLHAAQMALDAGQRYAAFGWASGNPEPEDWIHPQMLALLRLLAQHPDRLAVGLHEYSWRTDDILHGDGRLVGRFEDIMAVCRAESIPYPTTLVKEWGWTHNHVPQPAQAMDHILQVAAIYGRYPSIRGAAIWYLGPGFEGIANGAQRLIAPLTQLTLTTQVEVEVAPQPGDPPVPPPPPPSGTTWQERAWAASVREQINRGIPLNPQAALQAAIFRDDLVPVHREIGADGANGRITVQAGESLDGRTPRRLYYWQAGQPVRYITDPTTQPPPPPSGVQLVYRPCDTDRVTQAFGVNPSRYAPLPGHDGVDYGVAMGWPYYAAAAGRVVHASDRRWTSNTASAYGWHVVLDHGDYCTVYGHARAGLPVQVGQTVTAGQIVGYSGNTGNSDGYHLHFGLLDKTGTIDPGNGFPMWHYGRVVNPTPFLVGLMPPPPPLPPAETINVLPYLRGRDRVQFDLAYNGGTQTTQVRHLPNDRFLYVKGEPAEYECLAVRTYNGQPWIFRFEDTSESQTRFYAQFRTQGGPIGAPWVPTQMEVGRWYQTTKFVQHYTKTMVNGVWQGGCTPANSGDVVDRIRLMGRPYQRTYPSGRTLTVITLEWASGEQYDFCDQFGNVGFRDPHRDFWFLGGPLEGRPDKSFVKPTCIDVGW